MKSTAAFGIMRHRETKGKGWEVAKETVKGEIREEMPREEAERRAKECEARKAVCGFFALVDLGSAAKRLSIISDDMRSLVKGGAYDNDGKTKDAVEKWAFDLERMGQTLLEIKAEYWRLTQAG